MSGKVTDRDNGARALVERLHALARSTRRAKVGVLADAPKKGRAKGKAARYSLLEVAIVHEFGAPAGGIPQRSFIRATIDERRADIEKLAHAVAVRVAKGEITEDQGLSLIGAKVAGWIKQRIADGIDPPLAASTVARKKSLKPLIDTGQLRSGVTHVVEG